MTEHKAMMYGEGCRHALDLQTRSAAMTGTELHAEEQYIPYFAAAVKKMNMLERKAGQGDGFVCKSTAGRVVRLIRNHDSNIYTSPYGIGDCCTENGSTYRSLYANNVSVPSAWPEGWEEVTA